MQNACEQREKQQLKREDGETGRARLELVLAQRDRAAVVARVEVAGIRDKDAALLACMPCSGKRKRKAEMTDRGRQDKTERAD